MEELTLKCSNLAWLRLASLILSHTRPCDVLEEIHNPAAAVVSATPAKEKEDESSDSNDTSLSENINNNNRNLYAWPTFEAQANLQAVLSHCDSYPLSVRYYRALMKALEADIEKRGGEVSDDLMERVVEAYSTPLPSDNDHDVAHYTYVIPEGPLPIKGWNRGTKANTTKATKVSASSTGADKEEHCAALVPLRVLRDHNLVGMKTWEAGLNLAELCLACPPELFANKRVVELGAGIGSTAAILSRGLAQAQAVPSALVLTDFDHAVLENCRLNMSFNAVSAPAPAPVGGLASASAVGTSMDGADSSSGSDIVQIQHLDWRTINTTDDLPACMCPADVTLVADCTYSEDIIDHLLRTLECIVNRSVSSTGTKLQQKQKQQTIFGGSSGPGDVNEEKNATDALQGEQEEEEEEEEEEEADGDDLLLRLHTRYGPIVLLSCTTRSDHVFAHLQTALKETHLRRRDITAWAGRLTCGGLLPYGNKERIHTYCLYSSSGSS